ncbi:MAG: ROK family protein [Anaerovoracaceae bacterium]|jgi:glucokinase
MYRVGFDIGGTNIKAGIVGEDLKILSHRNIPFPTGESYKKVVALLAELVKDMAKDLQVPVMELGTIGIAVPGSIDVTETIVIHAHNLGFQNAPIKSEMKEYFPHSSIYLANDANAATLAELYAGAFRGCKTAVLLTLGTGVGGGLILGGRLFNGGMNHGVEPGHMIISKDGPLCSCGNRGCIESLCSATWLVNQGEIVIKEQLESLIFSKANGLPEQVTAKMVIDSAKEGDKIAREIFNYYIESLSAAVSSIINLLDPEVIALGGGVSLAGDFLFDPLRERVQEKCFHKVAHKIVPAQLGNDAGIIGAAMLGDEVHDDKVIKKES